MSEGDKKKSEGVELSKFLEELNEIATTYNKSLDALAKVQESSSQSENEMYKITLKNFKRGSSYVPTEDDKNADMATLMDFVETRQELVSAQKVSLAALQVLQNKQTFIINHVDKINGELERKLSELTTSRETNEPAPSRPAK